ncbi:E3 ubiquitin-protein ligase [Cyphellophora attinorum]|uniref:E3 ubiquitin-protein ligase n=1 Tax=Cyphellophora attinorum TaxID=1664694 RepID=A0A0N1NY55_9EURO|nr:E3 ubiquitin-protein ligase [Phialophora attinorum]KPI35130.1 E3 ubiquitin-protein ligase [Phialophora attinorum]
MSGSNQRPVEISDSDDDYSPSLDRAERRSSVVPRYRQPTVASQRRQSDRRTTPSTAPGATNRHYAFLIESDSDDEPLAEAVRPYTGNGKQRATSQDDTPGRQTTRRDTDQIPPLRKAFDISHTRASFATGGTDHLAQHLNQGVASDTDSVQELPEYAPGHSFGGDGALSRKSKVRSTPGPSTSVPIKRNRTETEERRPWYYDTTLKIDMYNGPGYERFPVALGTIEGHSEICRAFQGRLDKRARHETDPNLERTEKIKQRVLEQVEQVIPDICQTFVEGRIDAYAMPAGQSNDELAHVILNRILELDSYPKRPKQKIVKEQPAADGTGVTIPVKKEARDNYFYLTEAILLLAEEFPHVPTHHISRIVRDKRAIYDSYLHLHEAEQNYYQSDRSTRPYRRLKQQRTQTEKKYQQSPNFTRNPDTYGHWVNEIGAAKQHIERETIRSTQKEAKEKQEVDNLELHRKSGALVDCQICFDSEIPLNRTVSCLADEAHLFCYSCVNQLAETQVGDMKFEMKCQHGDGCDANLDTEGIGKAVSLKTMDRLAFNQQQAEITAAGIEGLEECPHCDFKAILDAVETNPVFKCFNPDCGRSSCRTCKEDDHTPQSCQEFKADRGLSARHLVEEARTASVLRPCPRCNVKIIKELGCNKMLCTKCNCLMCYICKIDITKVGYDHFNKPGSKCALYDNNTAALHDAEADAAELDAIRKAKAEDGDLDEKKLQIETGKPKKVAPPAVQRPLNVVPPPVGNQLGRNGFDWAQFEPDAAHRHQLDALLDDVDAFNRIDWQPRPAPVVNQQAGGMNQIRQQAQRVVNGQQAMPPMNAVPPAAPNVQGPGLFDRFNGLYAGPQRVYPPLPGPPAVPPQHGQGQVPAAGGYDNVNRVMGWLGGMWNDPRR